MTLSELIDDNLKSLVEQNATGIEEELRAAEDGRLSVSVGIKLCLIGTKVVAAITLQYSRKFKDEVEATAEIGDPAQRELGIA